MKNIEIESIILVFVSLLIIFIINKFRNNISKVIKLFDYPDNVRKLHSTPIPMLGGIMIFSSFFLLNIYLITFGSLNNSYFIIFICTTSCMAIGLLDDIKNISYKYKFLILIIIFFIFINLDTNLKINKIYFSTFDKEFNLNNFSIFFTILCLLLLTNALNLMDGLDGLCLSISIILFISIINSFSNDDNYYNLMLLSLFYILFLNLKKNIFLGDSGSIFLGCWIGLVAILNYNLEIQKNIYPVENIFIVFMLPGLDMFRVFLIRIINKKNPFIADRNHLHHLIIAKGFNQTKVLAIFILLISIPILINSYTSTKPVYIILSYILIYILLINKLKK